MEKITTYNEVDFLLPVQRFNINFSYVTQKGLPFVREFVLRLVHLAPMTKYQIATYFGFSLKEVDEAILDLVERDELTLSENGRLTLTEKSFGYFTEIGEVPRLSLVQDSGAFLSFDLATFTCLGKDLVADKWKSGIQIRVDDENTARSESLVEKSFQRQFNEILHKGFLPKSIIADEKDTPSVYTVNSVNKIRNMPLRLSVKFQVDGDGRCVEREDFEVLGSSDYVHERITVELDRLSRPSNLIDISKAMQVIGDGETLKIFDSKTNSVSLHYLDDLLKIEANSQNKRSTFLGPLCSVDNWDLLQRYLAPILKSRIESKTDVGRHSFAWLAPSDPYWCKNNRLLGSLSDFIRKATTKEKSLYVPTIYLPVSKDGDQWGARQWKQELSPHIDKAHGLVEGFLGGDVEIMHFAGELAVVVYHISLPDTYPVTLPLGFISTDKKVVTKIGSVLDEYINGCSDHEVQNDYGLITELARGG